MAAQPAEVTQVRHARVHGCGLWCPLFPPPTTTRPRYLRPTRVAVHISEPPPASGRPRRGGRIDPRQGIACEAMLHCSDSKTKLADTVMPACGWTRCHRRQRRSARPTFSARFGCGSNRSSRQGSPHPCRRVPSANVRAQGAESLRLVLRHAALSTSTPAAGTRQTWRRC